MGSDTGSEAHWGVFARWANGLKRADRTFCLAEWWRARSAADRPAARSLLARPLSAPTRTLTLMTVLTSRVDRASDAFAARAAHMEGLLAELTGAHRARRCGRRRARDRAPSVARQAHGAGAHRPARRPRHGLPRAERSRRLGDLRRRGAGGRDRDRDRGDRGPLLRRRRERRDGQGRLVLPAHRQEAPARPGGRRAEPPAVRLSRRLRRRVPATAGRRLPRPRALRAHLLQPGAPVREEHPAGRRRDGILHRRRRLRPRDERRDDHRRGNRHDLHRRPAARESGHRRGRDRRGARRRSTPHATLGRRRPLRRLRRARARARAPDRPSPRRPLAAHPGSSPHPSRPPSTRPTSTGSCPSTTGTSSTRSR